MSSSLKPFEILDIPETASKLQIDKAYRDALSFYSKDSVATYSLMDDDERQEKLKQVKEAYEVILAELGANEAKQAEIGAETMTVMAANLDSEEEAQKVADAVREATDDQELITNGAYLKRMREASGMTLENLAQRTKVGMHHLKLIEADDLANLPARVYVHGFVRLYLRAITPDFEVPWKAYMRFYDSQEKEEAQ